MAVLRRGEYSGEGASDYWREKVARLADEKARLWIERDEARADVERLREALDESERCRDSLRLERDGLEHVRLKDNAYLLAEVERLREERDHWKRIAARLRDA